MRFGATTLGMPVEKELWLQHQGRVPARIEALRLEPDQGVFSWAELPSELNELARHSLRLRYHPVEEGQHEAELVIEVSGSQPLRIALNGRGVDARAAFEAQVDFGRPALGAERKRTLLLRNSEETAVPVHLKIRGPDASEFAVTEGLILPPGSQALANLRYLPLLRPGKRDVFLEVQPCPLCDPIEVEVLADAVESALAFDPAVVHFGGVSIDSRRRAQGRILNLTDEAIELQELELQGGGDSGFAFSSQPLPLSLPGDGSMEVELFFSPSRLGNTHDVLQLRAETQPELWQLPLIADGGGAQLVVSPQLLDFRQVPVGGRWQLSLTLANGAADSGSPPLRIEDVQLSSADFSLESPISFPILLEAGERQELRVAFHPSQEGDLRALLQVLSNDPISPSAMVQLEGTGISEVDCELAVTPSELHFGAVQPGRGAILAIRIENVGSQQCSLWNGRLEGDPALSLQRDRSFARLFPGDALTIPVTFHPTMSGSFEALFRMESSSGILPLLQVPIFAGARNTCLIPEPRYLEFGPRRVDCGSSEAEVAFRNFCSSPVELTELWLGDGTDPASFQLHSHDSIPARLQPGEALSGSILYEPGVLGSSYRPLFALGSDSDLPSLLPLAAETLRDALHEEHFVQPEPSKVDVLWVIDNTDSMKEERQALMSAIGHFVNQADAMGVDYRMGVTTTGIEPALVGNDTGECPGGVRGGEAGRLFPVDHSRPRIIEPSQGNRIELLRSNLDVGSCHSIEQGLLAARLALSPPLVDNPSHPRTPEADDGNLGLVRRDAALAVVVVSDEDDQSPGHLDGLIEGLREVKPYSPLSFHAIVTPAQGCDTAVEPGLRYLQAVSRIGGSAASICEPNLEPMLSVLAQELFQPQQRFVLKAEAVEESIEVLIDGRPSSAWSYDSQSHTVLFHSVPPAGSDIHIRYQQPCGSP